MRVRDTIALERCRMLWKKLIKVKEGTERKGRIKQSVKVTSLLVYRPVLWSSRKGEGETRPRGRVLLNFYLLRDSSEAAWLHYMYNTIKLFSA